MVVPENFAPRLASAAATCRRSWMLLAGGLLLTLAGAACKKKEDVWTQAGLPQQVQEKVPRTHVAILADSLVTPMRGYQCALLESYVRTRPGMQVTRHSAGGDADEQARQIRGSMHDNTRFLVIFVQDVAKATAPLKEALKAGVTVIALTPGLPEDAVSFSIVCDEHRLGELAGDFVVQALKTKAADEGKPLPVGRVVQLRGGDGPASTRRAEGFMEALSREPGIVLVHDAPADWSGTTTPARVQEALRLQKAFDVVFGHNDLIATAAAKTLRTTSVELRETMLLLGTDAVPGEEGGISQVVKGTLDATVYNPPLVDLAWREMEALLDDSTHQPKKLQRVRPFIITSANAPDLEGRTLPAPVVE